MSDGVERGKGSQVNAVKTKNTPSIGLTWCFDDMICLSEVRVRGVWGGVYSVPATARRGRARRGVPGCPRGAPPCAGGSLGWGEGGVRKGRGRC